MMDAATVLLRSLVAGCVLWHVVSTMLIYDNLRRRGQKVSFIWLRLMSPWYASRYREITKSDTGRVSPLFYHWVVSINLALVLTLAVIAIHY